MRKISVLSISLEKKLLIKGHPVRERVFGYFKNFNKVTFIVFGKDRHDETVDNFRIISTGSWNKYCYVKDALRKVWSVRKDGYNAVMSQDPVESGLVAFLASRFLKAAFIVQDHGYTFHGDYYRKESWLNYFRYFLAKFLVRRADAVRVVSLRTQKALVDLGVGENKILRFPVNISYKLRVTSYKSDEKKYFLMVCRFVEIKRIDLALKAFKNWITNYESARITNGVKLKIVGQGPLDKQVHKWIDELGLGKNVEILPWTENLEELYSGAIATLITSDREGFGLTAVESLACGTPVIMTDVGCAGEYVLNNENGFIVPNGDVKALSEKMFKLVTSYKLQVTSQTEDLVSSLSFLRTVAAPLVAKRSGEAGIHLDINGYNSQIDGKMDELVEMGIKNFGKKI